MEPCTRRCTYLSPFLAVQGKHVDTMHLDTNKEHDPSARKGSTWESARKRISRPDSASIRYSLYDRVGRSAWAQKRSCTSCLPRLRPKAGRVIDTLPSTAWRGTLCTLSSSLVVPKARSSTSSTGISRLRQQVHLQFFQLRHHRSPPQPHQHGTPHPRSQHSHRKSIRKWEWARGYRWRSSEWPIDVVCSCGRLPRAVYWTAS